MSFIFFLYFVFGLSNAIILHDKKDSGLEVVLFVFFWPLVLIAIFSDLLVDLLMSLRDFFTEEIE